MRSSVAAAFAAITLALAVPAAADEIWTADLVHSRAEFTVAHLVVSKVWGHIPIRELKLTTGNGSPIPTHVDATLDVAHEDTDNKDRDADLRSPVYFDVARYPTMTFHSRRIVPTGANDFRIEGDLTIKGITHAIAFPVHVEGRVPDGEGTRIGYSAQVHVDRRQFGLVDERLSAAGVLFVGYDVAIGLTAEATLPHR